jgi:hypothetical protein
MLSLPISYPSLNSLLDNFAGVTKLPPWQVRTTPSHGEVLESTELKRVDVLHFLKVIDAEFHILNVNRVNQSSTFPLTIRDSGSAFISQNLTPRSSS